MENFRIVKETFNKQKYYIIQERQFLIFWFTLKTFNGIRMWPRNFKTMKEAKSYLKGYKALSVH